MKLYAKGAGYERELLHVLKSKGYAVIRSASSGGQHTPIDILAIKKGSMLAIECKAWAKMPKLDREKVEAMEQWCDKAGAHGFLAWRKVDTHTWHFLPLADVSAGDYSEEKWLSWESWVRVFTQ